MWQARFNPAHDCLLLSASSDALVNLWFLPALGGPPAAAPAAATAGEGVAPYFMKRVSYRMSGLFLFFRVVL